MFTIDSQVSDQPGRQTLVATGDIDIGAVSTLLEASRSAITPATVELLIDAERVRFIDSTGLRALENLRALAASRGIRLLLTNPSGPVTRLFVITGMTNYFDLLDSADVETARRAS